MAVLHVTCCTEAFRITGVNKDFYPPFMSLAQNFMPSLLLKLFILPIKHIVTHFSCLILSVRCSLLSSQNLFGVGVSDKVHHNSNSELHPEIIL